MVSHFYVILPQDGLFELSSDVCQDMSQFWYWSSSSPSCQRGKVAQRWAPLVVAYRWTENIQEYLYNVSNSLVHKQMQSEVGI